MDIKSRTARRTCQSLLLVGLASFVHTSVQAASQAYNGSGIRNTCSYFIKSHDKEATAVSLSTAMRPSTYSAVDTALECLMAEDFYFESGEAGSTAVALFYRYIFKPFGRPFDIKKGNKLVENWLDHSPESKYAQFAKLEFSYQEAWEYRGHAWAKDTSKLNFDLFYSSLEDVQDALLEPSSALHGTAMSAHLLLAISLDMVKPKHDPLGLYSKSISLWPQHHSFHNLIMQRLVPRWGGSWPLVEHVSTLIAEENKPINGDSLYAKINFFVHKRFKIDPRSTKVTWEKLEPALFDWRGVDPGPEPRMITASYSCLYNDMETYEQYREALKGHIGMFHGDVLWVTGTDKKSCDAKRDKWLEQ